MSATKTFTSQAVSEWVKLFPRQAAETYTSSATFMKQLTVVAISTITYLKNVFPEDSYTVESFGGIRLRSLKKRCDNELAQFVSSALTQAFDAFDKRYLHRLVLCFYEGECRAENLAEYHVLQYAYGGGAGEGAALEMRSRAGARAVRARFSLDAVRDSTLHLIRSCVVLLQSCQAPLPRAFDISLRLYYNEDAPEGYQAPGFLNTEEDEDHLASTLAESIKLGCVETPFHKLSAHAYVREAERAAGASASAEAIASQNPPPTSQMDHDDFDGAGSGSGPARADRSVQCPCNKCDRDEDEDGAQALLTCRQCGRQQHAACFGVRREQAARWRAHCCTACSDRDPRRRPTDRRLARLVLKKRECLCIFRRALAWCARAPAVGGAQLAELFHMSPLNAAKLMKLLHSHGVVAAASDSDLIAPRPIIHDQLQQVMSQFFQNESPDIVDRLIAETLHESDPDPVAEVLSPMDKVSLQSDTTVGRVVRPRAPPAADDTLKEYRDAMTLDDDKENDVPPLSGSHNPIDVEELGARTAKRKLDAARHGVLTKRARPAHPL